MFQVCTFCDEIGGVPVALSKGEGQWVICRDSNERRTKQCIRTVVKLQWCPLVQCRRQSEFDTRTF